MAITPRESKQLRKNELKWIETSIDRMIVDSANPTETSVAIRSNWSPKLVNKIMDRYEAAGWKVTIHKNPEGEGSYLLFEEK